MNVYCDYRAGEAAFAYTHKDKATCSICGSTTHKEATA